MKTAKDYLDEASTQVPRVPVEDALRKHAEGQAVFVDVRDSGAIAKTGTIAGAERVPRGFFEFAADASTRRHNPALTKDAEIYLVCGAGGQAALRARRSRRWASEGPEHRWHRRLEVRRWPDGGLSRAREASGLGLSAGQARARACLHAPEQGRRPAFGASTGRINHAV